ncbi:hypothetical protein J6590_092389 [Homalodisca vitripennis]|nr:hypothetical protein J6590_092389 [Homalodisca vitripennis]
MDKSRTRPLHMHDDSCQRRRPKTGVRCARNHGKAVKMYPERSLCERSSGSYLLNTNIKLEQLFSLQHLHNRRVIFYTIFQSKLISGLVDCPDLLVSFQSEIPPYIPFIELWSGKASEAWWQDVWKY